MENAHDAQKPATGFATFFLGLVGLVHLCRAAAGWSIVIEGFSVPVWWSGAVAVPLFAVAAMMWREAHR